MDVSLQDWFNLHKVGRKLIDIQLLLKSKKLKQVIKCTIIILKATTGDVL